MFKNVKTAEQLAQERLDNLATQARSERDNLLKETDYCVMPDYPIDTTLKTKVEAYRQALRDITKQSGFPETIDWPIKPEGI